MFVKPNTGLSIRDPDLKDLLPAGGRDVPETDYWHRRLRDQDVIPATDTSAQEGTGADAATAPQKKSNRSAPE